jgi:hypothetical protein
MNETKLILQTQSYQWSWKTKFLGGVNCREIPLMAMPMQGQKVRKKREEQDRHKQEHKFHDYLHRRCIHERNGYNSHILRIFFSFTLTSIVYLHIFLAFFTGINKLHGFHQNTQEKSHTKILGMHKHYLNHSTSIKIISEC